MRHHLALAAVLAAALGTLLAPRGSGAQETGSAEAGQAKAGVCAACHGADGNSVNPEWPSLAGQHADYLARALQQYRSGERSGNVMAAFATGLSDADIKKIEK